MRGGRIWCVNGESGFSSCRSGKAENVGPMLEGGFISQEIYKGEMGYSGKEWTWKVLTRKWMFQSHQQCVPPTGGDFDLLLGKLSLSSGESPQPASNYAHTKQESSGQNPGCSHP